MSRSVRCWIVAAAAFAVSLLLLSAFGELHARGAAYLPAADLLSPGMLIAAHRPFLLAVALVALTVVLFDFGARDEQARIAGSLDARPATNLARVTGLLLAAVATVWFPLAVAAGLWHVLARLGVGQVGVGDAFEAAPIAAFLVLDLIPALFLWGAMLVFLAGALRHRLAAVAVAAPLLVAGIWFMSWMPGHLAPAWPDAEAYPHRAALLAAGAGIATFAATVQPRLDDRALATRIAGIVLLGAGLLVLGTVASVAQGRLELRGRWLAAHAALDRRSEDVDLEHVAGRVVIEPGEQLLVDVDLRLRRRAQALSSPLVLSLNPGMAVQRLTLAGAPAPWSHAMGVLTVDVPDSLASAETVLLSVRAAGTPDAAFAHLDEAMPAGASDSGHTYLGTEAALFDADYVALMPAVAWLPLVGVHVRRDEPPADFHTVDLTVETPSGWRVAGPGRGVSDADGIFVFRPTAPVRQTALLAARFHRRAIEAAGVAVQLLHVGSSAASIEQVADLEPFTTARLRELFRDADRWGLSYPYDGLSFVVVPQRLRVVGGGWRLAATQALPGIVLLRESNLRFSRFAKALRPYQGAQKYHLLESYFRHDSTGGNPYAGVVRNLLQTSAAGASGSSGSDAQALDFLLETVMNRLLAQGAADFSAHDFGAAARLTALIPNIYLSTMATEVAKAKADIESAPVPSSVWRRALAGPLSELNATSDPRAALGVLRLKCDALATLLFDLAGTTRTALAVAELRRRFAGTAFTTEDLREVLASFDADLGDHLDDWLHNAALPGFLISEVEVYAADGVGGPQYPIRFHVRNNEPVGGYAHFAYGSSYGRLKATYRSDPVYLAGRSSVEVGLLGRMDPDYLFMQPYLALNRTPAYVDLYHGRDRSPRDVEPLYGTRPSAWRPEEPSGLIVDDLDAGFRVVDTADIAEAIDGTASLPSYLPGTRAFDIWRMELPWAWRVFVDSTAALRRRFTAGSQSAGRWMRQELASAWGSYRRTAARAMAGDGDHAAVFAATLPSAGRWRLAYHLPDLAIQAPAGSRGPAVVQPSPTSTRQGIYDMTLVAGERRTPVAFDATLAGPGWNEVGEFDLPAGPVALAVSNRTSGESVVADAIRWSAEG